MGKAKKKIERCKDGHRQEDVYQEKVSMAHGGPARYRYRCKRCKHVLEVPAHENLLGNPFDIIEKRDEVQTQIFLDHLTMTI